eukprot:5357663-Prymnesium_polylepis.2
MASRMAVGARPRQSDVTPNVRARCEMAPSGLMPSFCWWIMVTSTGCNHHMTNTTVSVRRRH